MPTATQPPAGRRVVLAIEPRLLKDTLAVALSDRGFVVLEAASLVGGCDVLITSGGVDMVDVRAGAIVRLEPNSSIADVVALIIDAGSSTGGG